MHFPEWRRDPRIAENRKLRTPFANSLGGVKGRNGITDGGSNCKALNHFVQGTVPERSSRLARDSIIWLTVSMRGQAPPAMTI